MRFKQFEIRNSTDIHNVLFKYRFELVKWANDNSYCWTIGYLEYTKKDNTFEFESCGLRYLTDRIDGLEEWLIKWCELKEIEFLYEEEK